MHAPHGCRIWLQILQSWLGRWVNRDPIEEQGGANVNSIVDNQSIDSIDILGLRRCCLRDRLFISFVSIRPSGPQFKAGVIFIMTATFRNDGDCCADCCEFRQLNKSSAWDSWQGDFRNDDMGADWDRTLHMDIGPESEHYRRRRLPNGDIYFDSFDTPGIPILGPGGRRMRWRVRQEFKAMIVDTCNSDNLIAEREYGYSARGWSLLDARRGFTVQYEAFNKWGFDD